MFEQKDLFDVDQTLFEALCMLDVFTRAWSEVHPAWETGITMKRKYRWYWRQTLCADVN